MRAVFVDGLDGTSGESESDSFLQFWNINALFLEIWVLSNHPPRVKLGSAGAVRISASHL